MARSQIAADFTSVTLKSAPCLANPSSTATKPLAPIPWGFGLSYLPVQEEEEEEHN